MDTKLLVYHKYGNRANQVAQPSSANCVKEKLLYAMDSLLAHLDQGCKNQVTINPHRWSGTVCFETGIA